MKQITKIILFAYIGQIMACGTSSDDDSETTNNNNRNNGKGDVITMSNNADTTKIEIGGACRGFEVCDDDGNCTTDQCVDGSTCTAKGTDFCDGTCQPFLATDAPCGSGLGECDITTATCDYSGTKTCKEYAAKGEVCFTLSCQEGLYCKKISDRDQTGICDDIVAIGDPCFNLTACPALTSYCDSVESKCKAKYLEINEPCVDKIGACKSPNICDPVMDICTPRTKFTCESASTNSDPTAKEKIAVGESCRGFAVCDENDNCVWDTCVEGSTCTDTGTDFCDGTCQPLLATGATCTGGAGECDILTAICDYSGTKKCTEYAAVGETCFTLSCQEGLYCKKLSDRDQTGVCESLATIGDTCFSDFACPTLTSYCDSVESKCKAKFIDLDGDCAGNESACKSPYTCDPDTDKCVERTRLTCD